MMAAKNEKPSGKALFTVGNQNFHTSFWTFGNIYLHRPLICVHGGPGIPSSYMKPFAALYQEYGIPVIIYDQIGCGQSKMSRLNGELHIDGAQASSFWAVELFMDELANLIKHFGISEFDLLGHSWGGMLCSEFAANRKPHGLRSLIIANSPAWVEGWCIANIKHLQSGRVSAKSVDIIRNAERHPGFDTERGHQISLQSEEYQMAICEIQHQFICQMDTWPEDLINSLAQAEEGNSAHLTMWGPEWCISRGNLRSWDVRPVLQYIEARTFVYAGVDDPAQPEVIEPFLRLIPGLQHWVQFNGAHCTHIERNQDCLTLIARFLLEE